MENCGGSFPGGPVGSRNVNGRIFNLVNQDSGSTGVQFGPHNVMNVTEAGAYGGHRKASKQKEKKPKKPLSNSEREPSRDQIDTICQKIGKYKEAAWKQLGEKLGLTRGEVETVEHDYCHSGTYEMCYQMLRRWRERQPTPVQIKILAQALCDIGRGDLSDVLAY